MPETSCSSCGLDANRLSFASPSSTSRCRHGGNPCLCQFAMMRCEIEQMSAASSTCDNQTADATTMMLPGGSPGLQWQIATNCYSHLVGRIAMRLQLVNVWPQP